MSLGGFCVQSDDALECGTKVTVVTRFPGDTRESRLPATVRWTRAGCFGVQFGPLKARDVCGITDLMRAAVRSRPRRLREEESPGSTPES